MRNERGAGLTTFTKNRTCPVAVSATAIATAQMRRTRTKRVETIMFQGWRLKWSTQPRGGGRFYRHSDLNILDESVSKTVSNVSTLAEHNGGDEEVWVGIDQITRNFCSLSTDSCVKFSELGFLSVHLCLQVEYRRQQICSSWLPNCWYTGHFRHWWDVFQKIYSSRLPNFWCTGRFLHWWDVFQKIYEE